MKRTALQTLRETTARRARMMLLITVALYTKEKRRRFFSTTIEARGVFRRACGKYHYVTVFSPQDRNGVRRQLYRWRAKLTLERI